MAREPSDRETDVNLSDLLTIANKSFTVTLDKKCISWSYKQKRPFTEKTTKLKCKNRIPIEEIVAIDYVERETKQHGSEIEMVCVNPTAFRLHVIKRVPKHIWKLRSIEMHCSSSAQCALWVDSLRSLLDKLVTRPKSLLVFINPFGGKQKGRQIFEDQVAPVFDLAGIRSHIIITEKANHAMDYLQTHDLSRYDGLVAVGGDGMFAELLNGLLRVHNTNMGVNLDADEQRMRQPSKRIGIIPAGSTDTVAYCTVGINDVVTSALHIVIGDDMSIDVCSVRHAFTGKLIRFCVSMLGYGFYGDVLKDSEAHRAIGPLRYMLSGAKTFIRNKAYDALVHYLPSQALQQDHHPKHDGSRCYSGCTICHSASLMELQGSLVPDQLSAFDAYSSVSAQPMADSESDIESNTERLEDMSILGSLTNLSTLSRPISSISKYSSEKWCAASGRFIGVNALTISCRCETVPEGVSPACHLGDGSADLVLVYNASRSDYFRHLWRIQAKHKNQFDFGFVNIIRVKAFKVRVGGESAHHSAQASNSFHRFDNEDRFPPGSVSCWNCDGEIIDEPNIDVRVHCQLVRIFARGIERPTGAIENCSKGCLSCAGVF